MKKFGLIGYPLGHSFSQPFFEKKFEAQQLDASYENFELASLDELAEILRKEPALKGLNVTIPYKTSIIRLLNEVDEEARFIQAVNAITVERQGCGFYLKGYNTDVVGFRNSIQPHLSGHQKALILGTGGAAKAAYHVLSDLDIECQLVSRNNDLGDLLYTELTATTIAEHTVLINCTPLGMYPNIDTAPEIPYASITNKHLLFDMVYNPAETAFLKRGKEHGATCINGQQMLEEQAEASWRIWNR